MAERKHKARKKQTVSPTLFSVGDTIKHPEHGIGVIKCVEENHTENYDLFYFADFTGKGGGGTIAWLPKEKTEGRCKVTAV